LNTSILTRFLREATLAKGETGYGAMAWREACLHGMNGDEQGEPAPARGAREGGREKKTRFF